MGDDALPPALLARRAELLGFVERRVRDRALAEDLVQTVFAHALERRDTLRDEDAIVAWLYRSLRNAIIDRHRRKAVESRALDALAAELDDRIEAIETAPPSVCRCVLRVAQGLKAEYADALQAIEVDGAQVKVFAKEHGISSSNAAVRVYRAREALRRGVLATCGACAEGGCVDCCCLSSAGAARRDRDQVDRTKRQLGPGHHVERDDQHAGAGWGDGVQRRERRNRYPSAAKPSPLRCLGAMASVDDDRG